jgi:hypothetical protein
MEWRMGDRERHASAAGGAAGLMLFWEWSAREFERNVVRFGRRLGVTRGERNRLP